MDWLFPVAERRRLWISLAFLHLGFAPGQIRPQLLRQAAVGFGV